MYIAKIKDKFIIDSGLANATSLSFSGDKGRLLENLVLLQLRKKYPSLYYYRGKAECDFVVREKGKIISLIQVCSELHSDNLQQEMDSLLEAMNFFELQEGTIITRNQSDRFQEKDKSIQVVPAWQWLGQW